MAAVRVSPAGYGIKLDRHDINISVHGLIGSLATAGDMAASLGKLGGAARDRKRSVSARGQMAPRVPAEEGEGRLTDGAVLHL